MLKRTLLFTGLLLTVLFTSAQKQLTLRDAVLKAGTEFAPNA